MADVAEPVLTAQLTTSGPDLPPGLHKSILNLQFSRPSALDL